MPKPGDGDDFDEDFEDDEEDLDFLDDNDDDDDEDDFDEDATLRANAIGLRGALPPAILDLDGADVADEDDVPGQPLKLGRPILGSLEPFERESLSTEELTTPPGLLYELRQFTGGKPIDYDPCSCPWSTTRATEQNMLRQYRAAQVKLSSDPAQGMRYKHNFPGKVSFGDGLARPFPPTGLTYVFPGFGAKRTQQWLQKVRTESIAQRSDPARPKVVQQGNELPFGGEIIMVVSSEHMWRPWFDYVWAADALCFLREPLWWGGAEARSKTGTILVYYGYRKGRFRRHFAGAGRVIRRGELKYTGPKGLMLFAPPVPKEERLVKEPKPVKPKKASKAKKDVK